MAVRVAVENLDGLPDGSLVSIKFAAKVLGRSERSLYRDIGAGRLVDIKIGGSRRIKVGDLRALAAGKRPANGSHATISLAELHAEYQGYKRDATLSEAYSALFNPDKGVVWDGEAIERLVVMGTELLQQANMVNTSGQHVRAAPALLNMVRPVLNELSEKVGCGHD